MIPENWPNALGKPPWGWRPEDGPKRGHWCNHCAAGFYGFHNIASSLSARRKFNLLKTCSREKRTLNYLKANDFYRAYFRFEFRLFLLFLLVWKVLWFLRNTARLCFITSKIIDHNRLVEKTSSINWISRRLLDQAVLDSSTRLGIGHLKPFKWIVKLS